MTYRALFLSGAALVGALAAESASAQVYFADNLEAASDATTFLGNASIGGDPNGDADPNGPQAGVWDLISEPQPWKIQVTRATTSGGPANPGPGPASGLNSLGFDRFGSGIEARGAFNAAATGLVSVEFDLWVNYGQMQFFPRNGTGGGYDGYPILVNFTATGQAQVNNGSLTAPFYTVDTGTGPADIDYNHVAFLIDLDAQNFSLTVDGQTLPELTNVAFAVNGAGGTQPVSQLQQIIFGEPTGEGAFYIDNVIVQAVPEPTSAALLALAGAGVTGLRRRRA